MKTSNYLAKFPPKAPSKASRHFGTIISSLWISQPHACVSFLTTALLTTPSKIPVSSKPYATSLQITESTAISFSKRSLYCKKCYSTFYENPCWTHSSLHVTQVLYDSLLLNLAEPISFSKISQHKCVI